MCQVHILTSGLFSIFSIGYALILVRGLVRVFTGRVPNFHRMVIGGQLWSPFLQNTMFLQCLHHIWYFSTLKDDLFWFNDPILEHFELFSNVAPFSGQVLGIRCQISTGARAPVAPVLTRALTNCNPRHLSCISLYYSLAKKIL